MEELVAELGAALLSADLGLTPEPRDDHAAYIASWLKVLKDDKRAIFTAASHAQRAADFLHGLQPRTGDGAGSMKALRFIEIDGKRHLWRDILALRKQQLEQYRRAPQPVLFDLKDDSRPTKERRAADRYLEPSLFVKEG